MTSGPGSSPAFAGRSRNLEDLRRIVAASEGPREVLAIVNGGDGDLVRAELETLVPRIFRADGATAVHAHEERTRRGQLLGLLDALRDRPLARVRAHTRTRTRAPARAGARGRVALGLMMPGKGTRLAPLTQRLYGIKPFLPTPLRPEGEGPFLHGAAASLWTWTLVVHHLERLGFEGVAWKWGDEPQIPATVLAALRYDLSDVDAVRFGAETLVTEDLARNKEWLFRDEGTGRLLRQVRRRPRAELLRAFGIQDPELEVRALVHIGSPAFSTTFLEAAEEAFGDLEGWLDVDGYLFEALTTGERAWHAEVERDAGLRALLARHPDFRERVRALAQGIEARRGRPPVLAVIDVGEGLYWGDVGQLAKARRNWLELLDDGEAGRFARRLAGLEAAVPDAQGNRMAGSCRVPADARMRDCVLVDSRIEGSAELERAVVVGSELGRVRLGADSVVLESTVARLETGTAALAFRAVAEEVVVAEQGVLTHLPADPRDLARGLEAWRADQREDVGTPALQNQPAFGNPTSFSEKFGQMRDRSFDPTTVEAEIATRFRTEVRGRFEGT